MECRHLDGNRENNRLVNLKWGTHTDNEKDKIKHGTSQHGERNPVSLLTNEQAEIIRSIYKEGNMIQKEIGKLFGVSQTVVSYIVRGVSYNRS